MNITHTNFLDELPQLEQLAKTATYMSADFEMTGLFLPATTRSQIDSIEERYLKMVEGIHAGYRTLQFGLTLSHYDPTTQTITHTPFNIYTFPSSSNLLIHGQPQAHSPILLDVDAIEFNSSHGMDFNEWVRSGVSFLPRYKTDRLTRIYDNLVQVEESHAGNDFQTHKDFMIEHAYQGYMKPRNDWERTALDKYTGLMFGWVINQLSAHRVITKDETKALKAKYMPSGKSKRGGYKGNKKNHNDNKGQKGNKKGDEKIDEVKDEIKGEIESTETTSTTTEPLSETSTIEPTTTTQTTIEPTTETTTTTIEPSESTTEPSTPLTNDTISIDSIETTSIQSSQSTTPLESESTTIIENESTIELFDINDGDDITDITEEVYDDKPIASWQVEFTFEIANDNIHQRAMVNNQLELTLWKLCHQYNIIPRVRSIKGTGDKKHAVVCTLYTIDKYQEYLTQYKNDLNQKKLKMYGITRVWQVLTNSIDILSTDINDPHYTRTIGASSPLIVHNGVFDLMFLYYHCEGDLPRTFHEFALEMTKFFPKGIYDTKLLFAHPITTTTPGAYHFKYVSSSLGNIFHWFKKEQQKQFDNEQNQIENKSNNDEQDNNKDDSKTKSPYNNLKSIRNGEEEKSIPFPQLYIKHQFRPNFDIYEIDESKCHEAGYDSWITAVLFCNLLVFISSGKQFQKELQQKYTNQPTTTDIINRLLASSLFREYFQYRINSFGQYVAFNLGYVLKHPNTANFHSYTSHMTCPPLHRVDTFIITFRTSSFFNMLLDDGILPHDTTITPYNVIYPSDIAKALKTHFTYLLSQSEFRVDPDDQSTHPSVDVDTHHHNSTPDTLVVSVKIGFGPNLLQFIAQQRGETYDVNKIYPIGNIFKPSEFAHHFDEMLQHAVQNLLHAKDSPKTQTLQHQQIMESVLPYLTTNFYSIYTLDQYMIDSDVAHLRSIGRSDVIPYVHPSVELIMNHSSYKSIDDISSSVHNGSGDSGSSLSDDSSSANETFQGAMINFIAGTAFGFTAAAVTLCAYYLYATSNTFRLEQ